MSNTDTDTAILEVADDVEEEPTEAQVAAAAATMAAEAKATPEVKKVPKYVAVMVTPEQYRAIETFANGKALSGVCLQVLADTIGFTVEPPKPARQKYATEAERKAAVALRNKSKNAAIADFLKAHAAEFEKLMAAKAAELAAAATKEDAAS